MNAVLADAGAEMNLLEIGIGIATDVAKMIAEVLASDVSVLLHHRKSPNSRLSAIASRLTTLLMRKFLKRQLMRSGRSFRSSGQSARAKAITQPWLQPSYVV